MSLNISVWPDLDRSLMAIALVLSAGAADLPALNLSGHTGNGMAFTGEALEVTDGVLKIRPGNHRDSLQIGVALDSLQSLTLDFPQQLDARFEAALTNLLPLTPYWDKPTLLTLLAWVKKTARNRDWPRVYFWTDAFIPVMDGGTFETEVRLLKAQALEGMGLHGDLAGELEILNKAVPPVDAPPILCWLNARCALRSENSEAAWFWASLPTLQIPVKSGPLVDELARMAAEVYPGPGNPHLSNLN